VQIATLEKIVAKQGDIIKLMKVRIEELIGESEL